MTKRKQTPTRAAAAERTLSSFNMGFNLHHHHATGASLYTQMRLSHSLSFNMGLFRV